MIPATETIKYARQYRYYKLENTISELRLRESLSSDYEDSVSILTNWKRTLIRNLENCGFDWVGALLN